jgi:hypothetical protein
MRPNNPLCEEVKRKSRHVNHQYRQKHAHRAERGACSRTTSHTQSPPVTRQSVCVVTTCTRTSDRPTIARARTAATSTSTSSRIAQGRIGEPKRMARSAGLAPPAHHSSAVDCLRSSQPSLAVGRDVRRASHQQLPRGSRHATLPSALRRNNQYQPRSTEQRPFAVTTPQARQAYGISTRAIGALRPKSLMRFRRTRHLVRHRPVLTSANPMSAARR